MINILGSVALYNSTKGKPAGAIMENKAAAAAAEVKSKPAGAVKKTMKVRVPQGYIDTLLADPPRRVSYGLPEEVLQRPPSPRRNWKCETPLPEWQPCARPRMTGRGTS